MAFCFRMGGAIMNHNSGHEDTVSSESSVLIRRLWREVLKTSAFLLATLIVIVIGSIAWFANNTRTQATTASVSAQYDPLRLATKGQRQIAEKDYLRIQVHRTQPDGTILTTEETLPDGDTHPYEEETYYVTENGAIALRLDSDNISVRPGFSGEVTFYIIPKRAGKFETTLYLELAGYRAYTENNDTKARRVEDNVLDALLGGHILLFQDREYDKWLWTENGSVLHISKDVEDDDVGVPLPVTFYWYWPLRYEDMKVDWLDRTLIKPLPTTPDYRYNRVFIAKAHGDIPQTLTDDKLCDEAYNRADEYIGSHADFLYLSIQASHTEEPTS